MSTLLQLSLVLFGYNDRYLDSRLKNILRSQNLHFRESQIYVGKIAQVEIILIKFLFQVKYSRKIIHKIIHLIYS